MIIKVPEKLETERLILNFIDIIDTESIFSCYAQDKEVSKYLAWIPHKSIEQTKKFVQQRINEISENRRYTYTVKSKTKNELIGMVSLKFVTHFRVSFSYLIVRKHWGNGFGAETVSKVIEWCSSKPEIYRIEAFCDENNDHSVKVLFKAGMKKETILKRAGCIPNISEEPGDSIVFSIIK
jgi:[ribosomal protein S5]-alanine N-acetyltransferase